MITFLFQVGLLFVFWVALSGIFDAFHLSVGLVSALALAFWAKRTHPKQKKISIGLLLHYIVHSLIYSVWLIWQIILAAIHVSKLILTPGSKIAPAFITHKTKLKGDEAKTIFGNSITLTPGTITVDIQGDDFIVHEIDHESSEGIRSGAMENKIEKIFSKEPKKPDESH